MIFLQPPSPRNVPQGNDLRRLGEQIRAINRLHGSENRRLARAKD